ncbi:HmuY family protein [Albibacterium indicum]|uniref:HmuY family protein n=1 Tax=Albibacterium indicum TaxID=2292082 RepID=UPI000E50D004|nr:HmuY family protein [Pedobacter indicus]
MKKSFYNPSLLFLLMGTTVAFTSCERGDDPIPDIPPSDGTELTLDGGEGGSSAANTVFVDLSADKQSSVKRTSWNLGFYNGSQFRVVLNNTAGASAVQVNKADLNAVSESDVNLDDLAIALGSPNAFDNIDDLTGDLSKTLIPEISATADNNKVFVVNPVGGSHGAVITADDLYKIRILREGNDYVLQYAKLNDTDFSSLTVKKDEGYNFNYVSFTEGPLTVEPLKAEWDFQWTWSLYAGSMPNGDSYPYGYSDMVFINHHAGVSAAEIVFEDAEGASTGEPTYEDFAEADLAGVSFANTRGVIASSWRKTTGTPLGAQPDRFYLIKDGTGNVYKLRFISMGAGDPPTDGGKRGYPELEYKLVVRGN